MSQIAPAPERLADMPLWRLLVLLNDLEREVGASSPTARLVARLVNERLRGDGPSAAERMGGRHAN
jgi:hypothetical protein